MTWTLSAFADEAGPSTDVQIQALQQAGYRHIDLRHVDGHNIAELPLDLAADVRRKLDAAGIRVNMFGSPIGKIDIADDFQIDVRKLEHLGQLADVLGCHAVRLFSYYNKAGLDLAQWQSTALDRLKRLTDLADRLGLVLYHENEKHIFGDRCEQVVAIADALHGQGPFRLIFDFDNYNQSGDDVWANWQTLKDRTDAFHLKDSTAQNMHVPIGQGNGRAREILADALARGWQGPLSLEPHLTRSEAVVATNASGEANRALKDLGPYESFGVAATVATELLREIGASVN